MSIIKNTSASNAMKIVAFGSNGEIPKTNASGVVSNSGYIARDYIIMTGYAQLIAFPSATDSIIVWAEIPSGASGYLLADDASSHQLTISVSNGTITFRNGSTTTTHAWQPGFHYYGFINTASGVKAMYDNETIGSVGVHSLTSSNHYRVGGDGTSNIASVKIRKVIVHSAAESGGNKMMLHYYPCTSTQNVCMFYETRYFQNALNNITGTSIYGPAVKYGISIDDLRECFGCGHRDVVGCILEDGGHDSSAGFTAVTAKEADRVRYTEGGSQVDREFAFAIANGASTRTNAMPLPTGASVQARVNDTYSYTRGDLIQGRTPKWSIWEDNIRFGFYVKNPTTQTHQLHFNIYKFLTQASARDINLTMMEKIGHSSTAPEIQLPTDGWTIEFNNRLPYRCDADTLAMGILPSTTYDKSQMIFVLSTKIDGDVKARAGNAIPWAYTPTELQDTDMAVYGYAVKVEAFNAQRAIVNAVKCGSAMLSSSTSASVKTDYKTTFNTMATGVSNEFARLLYDKLYAATGHSATATATLALVNTANTTPETVTNNKLITLERLMAAKTTTLKGEFNNDFRIYVDYHLTAGTYAGIQTFSRYYNETYVEGVSGEAKRLFLPIMPCSADATVSLTDKTYYAVWECYKISSDTLSYRSGIKRLIDKDELQTEAYQWWGRWVNRNEKYLSLNVDGAVVSKDNGASQIQGSAYSRILMLTNDVMAGSSANLPTSTSIVLHIYDSATAPVLYEPHGGEWQNTTQSVFQRIGQTSECWLYSKPYELNENYLSSYIGKCLVRRYSESGGTWEHTQAMEQTFQHTVKLYKNGSEVASFNINLTSTDASAYSDNNGYRLTVTKGCTFPGYWYDPTGSFSYYGIDGFFELTLTSRTSGTACARGDLFSTEILS